MSELRPARLLLVDDNRVNRLLLARQLAQLGHQVDVAENGSLALQMLRGPARAGHRNAADGRLRSVG
jgi:CheY-like chemotaxis protein